MDFGIIPRFCNMTNSVIRLWSNKPRSRLKEIRNDRYCGLSALGHLSFHCPFRTSKNEPKYGISGKSRVQSASFLVVLHYGGWRQCATRG